MRLFKIGDTVIFDPGVKSGLTPESVDQVVDLVTREDNVTEYLYRIQSSKEAGASGAGEPDRNPTMIMGL
jgi:hypothetical protein